LRRRAKVAVVGQKQGGTKLKNLEYLGISLNMENSGILGEFCATSGKIVTNKIF